MPKPSKISFSFLFITFALGFADSARILDQFDPQTTLSPLFGQNISISPNGPDPINRTMILDPNTLGQNFQVFVGPPVAISPLENQTTETSPIGPGPSAQPSILPLSFFMHDILGGSHPSARVVIGIVTKSKNPSLPFSKPNDNFFPLPGSIPLITVGQIPSGAALQHLLFGAVTTIDDELTEGEELGSAVIGRAQGFYLTSSSDGTSHTVALTVMLHEHNHDNGGDLHQDKLSDTISFFGVHRVASLESQIAVVGGTGKYEEARGFATIENLHSRNHYETDGTDTIVNFKIYLSNI